MRTSSQSQFLTRKVSSNWFVHCKSTVMQKNPSRHTCTFSESAIHCFSTSAVRLFPSPIQSPKESRNQVNSTIAQSSLLIRFETNTLLGASSLPSSCYQRDLNASGSAPKPNVAAGGPRVGCTRVHCADRLIVDLCSRPAARSPRVGVSVMVRRMYRHGNERLQAQDRSQRARRDRSQISTTDVYKVSREMKASRRECLSLYTLPTGHIRIFPSSQQIPEYSPLSYNAPAIIHTWPWVPSPEYKNVHCSARVLANQLIGTLDVA